MKKFMALFATLLFLTSVGCAQNKAEPKSDTLSWYINLEEAVKVAKEENKNILVNFTGSDWCVWCIRLSDEVFTQDEFGKYAKDNFDGIIHLLPLSCMPECTVEPIINILSKITTIKSLGIYTPFPFKQNDLKSQGMIEVSSN